MQPENQGEQWHSQANVAVPIPSPGVPSQPATEPQQYAGPEMMIEWQASEYVHHEKQTLWFVILFAVALVLALVAVFLIKSYTFALLIIAMTVAVAVYAVRPPRLMQYRLSPMNIQINDKLFPLNSFRYFGVVQEGPLYSILLIPIKRFMPAVTLYFPQENGEQIVDLLGSRLPMEEVKQDAVEKAIGHLRF